MIVDRAALNSADRVLEIGAGLGALTLPLARCVRKVYALEVDAKMAGLLRNELLAAGADNVTVLHQDVLQFAITSLRQDGAPRLIVLGNLPYHISSQVLFRLIQSRQAVERAVLMFQKELAQRIASAPGSRQYGRLTVMLAYCADVRHIARIAPGAFFPVPQVESDVVEIRFAEKWHCTPEQEAFLFRVIKAAFSQRRKTLKNALAGGMAALSTDAAERILRQSGIDPRRRAETLSVSEFITLSRALSDAAGAAVEAATPPARGQDRRNG